MTLEPYSKPLVFSGYHGDNIVLSDNGLLSEGQYLTAHGQFITHGDLGHNHQFGLEFQGTGIVKCNVFKFRREAEKWVLSKQPLQKGCKRLKMKGLAQYNVVASETDNCVRVESRLRTKTKTFIFDKGPEATLVFDIECGDVVVSIVNTPSHVTFDTCYRSPYVEITNSQRMSSARLHHYNPSALCCLDNTPLKPGTVFELEARHSGQSTDSGSYIRVCVSQLRSPYVNEELSHCSGSATVPAFSGKRMCLAGGDTEVLQVTVAPDGLILDRGNKIEVEKLMCPIAAELTLWFELHKASVRAWQRLEYNIPNVIDELTAPTHQTFLSREPPLPPVCGRRTRKYPMLTHAGYTEAAPDEAGLNDRMSSSWDMSIPIFTNNYASYVSADSLCGLFQGAAHPRYTPNANDLFQCDLLSDLNIDSTVLNSIQSNLLTLSSLESYTDSRLGDLDSLQPINSNTPGNESIYERPNRIWLHSRNVPGQMGSNLMFNNNHEETVSDNKITKRHLAMLSQTSQTAFLLPKTPDASCHRKMPNRHTGCPEGGEDVKMSNYVLKLSATAFLQSYRDDSTNELYNRQMGVLHGCGTTQSQESRHDTPTTLHKFQLMQCHNDDAFHSHKINRYVGYISPGSLRADDAGGGDHTDKNYVPVNIPTDKNYVPVHIRTDNNALSNTSDASVVSSQTNRRLVRDKSFRDKTKCQQLSNSFRRRCVYMSKKPDMPPSMITASFLPETPAGTVTSHVMESRAEDALVPATLEKHVNTDKVNFRKCNSTASGKDTLYNYLASLTLRAPKGKTRSVSNASDQDKKVLVKRSRFFGRHRKDKTQCDNVMTRPMSPVSHQ